jgi:hypothetical protein
MIKSLAIAAFAAMLALGTAGMSSAIDPLGGQSSSQLNSLDSRSGSPSETGKTGIGSTSGTDASIDTGLKATTQPCVASDARPGMDPAMKTDRSTGKPSAADAAREAMSNVKKPDSTVNSDTTLNPDARSSAETSARMGTSSNPCPESRP